MAIDDLQVGPEASFFEGNSLWGYAAFGDGVPIEEISADALASSLTCRLLSEQLLIDICNDSKQSKGH